MRPSQWRCDYEEYRRLQEDLDAFLNVPNGVVLSPNWFDTVRWLENRIGELRKILFQPKRA